MIGENVFTCHLGRRAQLHQPGPAICSLQLHQELIPQTIVNMRLLNIKTLRLEWFHSADDAPSYAILSHRWEDEEVLFEDVEERPEAQKLRTLQMKLKDTERRLEALSSRFEGGTQSKDDSDKIGLQMKLEETERRLEALSSRFEGGTQSKDDSDQMDISDSSYSEEMDLQSDVSYPETRNQSSTSSTPEQPAHVRESQETKPKAWAKVLGCCKIAELRGISYVWIDTCCIDKSSSSELSESINSMFAWYRKAPLCIAYLSDVTLLWGSHNRLPGRPESSGWFKWGWTLQELIAPEDIWFFDSNWKCIGIRSDLVDELSKITHIEKELLQRNGVESLHSCSVAARMSCKFSTVQSCGSS